MFDWLRQRPECTNFLEAVFRSSPDAIAFVGTDHIVRAANDNFASLNHRPLDSIVGHPCWEIVPGWASRLMHICEEVRQTGKPFRAEDYPLPADDQREPDLTYWDLTVTATHNASGSFVGWLLMLRDVTERMRANALRQQALNGEREARAEAEQARRRLTIILESITDAFFALDAQFRFTYVNKKAAEIWQLKREELIGRSIWDIYPQFAGTDLQRQAQKILAAKKSFDTEFYYPPTDQWIHLRAYPANGGLSAYFEDVTERKRAEQTLRESEERFRAFFEQPGVGTAIVGLDGHWMRVNQRMSDILGYSPAEMTTMTTAEVTYPPDLPAVAEHLRQMLAGRINTITVEKRYLRKDGSLIWGRLTIALVRHQGQPSYFVAIVEDISERKRAEQERERLLEEVQRQAAELDATVNSIAEGVLISDPRGHIVRINAAAGKMVKYWPDYSSRSPADWTRLARLETAEGEPLSLDKDPLLRALRGEITQGTLLKANLPDGTVRWATMSAAPIRTFSDHLLGAVVTLADITDIRELQEGAARRAEEFDATLWSIREGLIIYGPQLQVLRINSAAERIIGFSAEEWRRMSHPERVKSVHMENERGRPIPPDRTPLCRALKGETLTNYRMNIHRPDGKTLYLLVAASPIRQGKDKIIGAVANFTDVTQLVELVQLRDVLTSTIAHDIRQPLTTILGQAQMAERALSTNRTELAKHSAEAVVTSARRMNVMIQDLVDSVRMEAGRLTLNLKPIDLGEFLRELLQRSSATMD
ncbi:MAG TPA: PAS domain S-box protein, partial [Chloroflexota bacterium]|nr:PAS domain S-box protein [Chloroflexota bacterium]